MSTRDTSLVIAVDENTVVGNMTGLRSVNKINPSSVEIGKTPSRTNKIRRALGDISNHRQDRSGYIEGKEKCATKTPSSKLGKPEPQKKILETKKSTSQRKVAEGVNHGTVGHKSTTRRKVDFVLDDKKPKTVESFQNKSQHDVYRSSNKKELDELINELRPAGRTWIQQIKNGDHDEDYNDDFIADVTTFLEDRDKVRQEEIDHFRLVSKEEDDEAAEYLKSMVSDWIRNSFDEGKRYWCYYIEGFLKITHSTNVFPIQILKRITNSRTMIFRVNGA